MAACPTVVRVTLQIGARQGAILWRGRGLIESCVAHVGCVASGVRTYFRRVGGIHPGGSYTVSVASSYTALARSGREVEDPASASKGMGERAEEKQAPKALARSCSQEPLVAALHSG